MWTFPTGGFEGPQGNLYVILTTDVDIAVRDMGRSVLLRAGDPFGTLTEITTISQATNQHSCVRFINVAPVKLADGASLGLPGPQILWFGTGLYRKSDVYLAAIPASSIERKETWKYWDGAGWAGSELLGGPVIETVTWERFRRPG